MRNKKTIPNEIRDKYFFIDYLRLHKFGKDNQIWSKNRNMLVKTDEYNVDPNIKSRKGYMSYVQRCFKSILDWLYPDFTVIKPRMKFSYEIGRRDNYSNPMSIVSKEPKNNEDKVRFAIARYLNAREYAEYIEPLKNEITENKLLSTKNRGAGVVVKLDKDRSFSYEALKSLIKIRKIHNDIIADVSDIDKTTKRILRNIVFKCIKLPEGSIVEVLDGNRRVPLGLGRVIEDKFSNDSLNSEVLVQVENMLTPNTVNKNRLKLISIPTGDSELQAKEVTPTVNNLAAPLNRTIVYAQEMFATSRGLNAQTIFSLARAAIVRELVHDGKVDLAATLRRYEPGSEDLELMPSHHEGDDTWGDDGEGENPFDDQRDPDDEDLVDIA